MCEEGRWISLCRHGQGHHPQFHCHQEHHHQIQAWIFLIWSLGGNGSGEPSTHLPLEPHAVSCSWWRMQGVCPGTTCTPVFSSILLWLKPVTDLASEATVASRNFNEGLLVFIMEFTNSKNLLSSISFRILPLTSSRIQRCVDQGRSKITLMFLFQAAYKSFASWLSSFQKLLPLNWLL